ASDRCEGRGVTTQGVNLAADYIAAEFQKAGLKPGGPDHSYFQPFTIPANTLVGPSHIVLRGPRGQTIELKQDVHFEPIGLSNSGKVTGTPLVFAGYGASTGEFGYDDYAGLDVEGKAVIV